MNGSRILRHVLFWTVFYLSALFHETYFSSSFSKTPSWDLFFQIAFSQLLLFLIKAAVVYYSIYYLIPSWSQHRSSNIISDKQGYLNVRYLIHFIIVLLLGALFMRITVQLIVWPIVFHEPVAKLSFISLLARYMYSLFDLVPVALTAVAIKLVQLQMRALQTKHVLVQEKLNSELLYLKSQTNPHFLFNTLNSIYVLSRKQDKNAPEAIMQLSKMLRYILHEPLNSLNPISKEIELINDFIALQKLRFQDHIDVSFNVNLDSSKSAISPLLLLPLVENAFKHSNGSEMNIQISIEVLNEKLEFRVINNMEIDSLKEEKASEGIGLSNIKRQLELLYRNYTFSTHVNGNHFHADLSIDLTSFIHV